jgi:hypothetical protein
LRNCRIRLGLTGRRFPASDASGGRPVPSGRLPHTFCAKRRKNVEPEATVWQWDMHFLKPSMEKLLHDSEIDSIIATFGVC